MKFSKAESRSAEKWFTLHHQRAAAQVERSKLNLTLQVEQTRKRLSNLTNALVDGLVEKDMFVQKKNSLVMAEKELKDKLATIKDSEAEALRKTKEFVRMANSAHVSYMEADFRMKR